MIDYVLPALVFRAFVSLLVITCLAACGASGTAAPTAAPAATVPAVTTAGPSPAATPSLIPATPTATGPPSPSPSATPTIKPTPVTPAAPVTPSALASPQKNDLRYALQVADGELRAAQASSSLAEARQHAEGSLNASVGAFGRWYGDADHDGQVEDPSNGSGILPGERVPGPPPDVGTPVFPFGAAFLALDNGNAADRAALEVLLGDVELWRSTPRKGYDAIDAAVQSGNAQKGIAALGGSVPRAAAATRYILVKAQTLDEAKPYAALGAAQTGAALDALRKAMP